MAEELVQDDDCQLPPGPALPRFLEKYATDFFSNENFCCSICGGFTDFEHPQQIEKLIAQPLSGDVLCVKFHCGANGCKGTSWFVCHGCDRRFSKKAKLIEHVKKKHTVALTVSGTHPPEDSGTHSLEDNAVLQPPVNVVLPPHQPQQPQSPQLPNNKRDHTLAFPTPHQSHTDPQPLTTLPIGGGSHQSSFTVLLCGDPQATLDDVKASFTGMDAMQEFWTAEHAYPGGGIQHIVSKAFTGTSYLGKKVPSLVESRWHIMNFIQYISLSDKQRRRQALLSVPFLDTGTCGFFDRTHHLEYLDLRTVYGHNNTAPVYSLWRSLPIPPVEVVNDIAYVNPLHICRFALANVKDMDLLISTHTTQPPERVFHVSECEEVHNVMKATIEAVGGGGEGPINYRVVVAWAMDWRDGFGPTKVKNNRKSIIAWTWSLATPRNRINSSDNTFPLAIGMKKSMGWTEVEHRVNRDLKELYHPSSPQVMYHAGTKKMASVFIRNILSMADRPEKAEMTATIGPSSDYHRCFGVSIQLSPPFCVNSVVVAYKNDPKGNGGFYPMGWADALFLKNTGNAGRLLSCLSCRKFRAAKLCGGCPVSPTEACRECADWDIDSASKIDALSFVSNPNYPSNHHPDCPVEPPFGRKAGVGKLPPVRLTFSWMKDACRYAFYHVLVGTGPSDRWNGTQFKYYLRSCCVNEKTQKALFDYALRLRLSTGLDGIDFNNPAGIGEFSFPPAWIGPKEMDSYIELIMHQLFLGIAASMFVLISGWIAACPGKSKSFAKFRETSNSLILPLRNFNLSWLPLYLIKETSGSKKKGNGTGNWVSENWYAWTRISVLLYAWCSDSQDDSMNGADNVLRVVDSFVALVARIMTHGGVTDADISSTDDFIKEFLSSIAELDLHVNHSKMSGSSIKVSDVSWLKSNFVSLLNIARNIKRFGPCVNMYDGGGKGEKFIQEIKALIPTGLRAGVTGFLVALMQKIYRHRQLVYFERMYLDSPEEEIVATEEARDSESQLQGLLNDFAEAQRNSVEMEESHGESEEEEEEGGDEDEDENEEVTPQEDKQMGKERTIFIYKNQQQLDTSLLNGDPISGVVCPVTGTTGLSLYAVFHIGRSEYGWKELHFDDRNGIHRNGLWYAAIKASDPAFPPPQSRKAIAELAKLAAVAVSHGENQQYFVFTNWWKQRNSSGRYVLPGLNPNLYEDTPVRVNNNSSDTGDIGERNGGGVTNVYINNNFTINISK